MTQKLDLVNSHLLNKTTRVANAVLTGKNSLLYAHRTARESRILFKFPIPRTVVKSRSRGYSNPIWNTCIPIDNRRTKK